jgi:DNA-binding MarR family transcriptional regulator
VQELLIETIRTDGGVQSRERINEEYVTELVEVIKGGKRLPPIEVYGDGNELWAADGFHRILAHLKADKRTIRCNVHKGSRADAIWASCAANKEHGLRRTHGDLAKAIKMAVEAMPKMSQTAIAQHVGCTHGRVSQVVNINNLTRPDKVSGKDGKKYPARKIKPPWEVEGGDSPPPPPSPPTDSEVSEEVIDEALEIINSTGLASTAALQRQMRISHATACQIMDELEARGIVGPADGDEPRELLIKCADAVSVAAAVCPRKDGVGKPIPDQLLPLFDRSPEVHGLLTQISNVKGVLKRAEASGDELYQDVNFNSAFAALVTAYDDIKATMPYVVCPWCGGVLSDQCRGCGHRGVLGRYRFDNTVPKELK